MIHGPHVGLQLISSLRKEVSIFISGARIVKTSQWRRAVENRCVFNARLKALSAPTDPVTVVLVADGSM